MATVEHLGTKRCVARREGQSMSKRNSLASGYLLGLQAAVKLKALEDLYASVTVELVAASKGFGVG